MLESDQSSVKRVIKEHKQTEQHKKSQESPAVNHSVIARQSGILWLDC